MRNKIFLLVLFCLSSIFLKAQFPSGLPSPNSPTSYYNVGWIREDSGHIFVSRQPNFTPLFPFTTIGVLRPGVDTTLWLWTGQTWNEIGKGGGITGLVGVSPIVFSGDSISCPTCSVGGGITQLTGDGTAGPGAGSQPFTLATVNTNVGSFGDGAHVADFTVNGKGLITGAGSIPIQIAESQVTNLVSDLASKQGVVTLGSTSQYFRGDLSLATFPTNLSSFTNGPGYITGITGIAAGGALTGTYPNPTLTSVVTAGTCTNCALTYNGAGQIIVASSGSGGGAITGGGGLSPLFTNGVSGSTLTFTPINVTGYAVYGHFNSGTGVPGFSTLPIQAIEAGTANTLLGWDGSGNPSQITFTTTGNSGPATLSSTLLNIPQLGLQGTLNNSSSVSGASNIQNSGSFTFVNVHPGGVFYWNGLSHDSTGSVGLFGMGGDSSMRMIPWASIGTEIVQYLPRDTTFFKRGLYKATNSVVWGSPFRLDSSVYIDLGNIVGTTNNTVTFDSVGAGFKMNGLPQGAAGKLLIHVNDSSFAQLTLGTNLSIGAGGVLNASGGGGASTDNLDSVTGRGFNTANPIVNTNFHEPNGEFSRAGIIGGLGMLIRNVLDTTTGYGDSRMVGVGSTTAGWFTLFGVGINSFIINKAIAGTTLVRLTVGDSSFEDRLAHIPYYSGSGFFVMEYDVNDMNAGTSVATFKAKYMSMVDSLIADRGVPVNKLVLMAGSAIGTTSGNTVVQFKPYADAVRAVAAAYGCISVDGLNFMVNNGYRALMTSDSIHFNQAGHDTLSLAAIYSVMPTIYSVNDVKAAHAMSSPIANHTVLNIFNNGGLQGYISFSDFYSPNYGVKLADAAIFGGHNSAGIGMINSGLGTVHIYTPDSIAFFPGLTNDNPTALHASNAAANFDLSGNLNLNHNLNLIISGQSFSMSPLVTGWNIQQNVTSTFDNTQFIPHASATNSYLLVASDPAFFSGATGRMFFGQDATGLNRIEAESADLAFFTGVYPGTEKMRLKVGGNFLMGLTADSSTGILQVNGGSWFADSVIEKNVRTGTASDSLLVWHQLFSGSGVIHKVAQSSIGGGGGVTTVGTFSGSSIANGASISGSTITFGPADATNPGMIKASGSQILGATLTLTNAPIFTTTSTTGAVWQATNTSGQGGWGNIVTSGTYTPTLTNTTNISSSSLNFVYYTRNGNIIHVMISGSMTCTSGATSSTLTFSLPFTTSSTTQGQIGQGFTNGNLGSTPLAFQLGYVNITSGTTGSFVFQSSALAGTGFFNLQFDYTL